MTPGFITSRALFLFLFLVCASLMAFGYFLQYRVGLEPCPLCMTQRVFIVAAGLTALAAAIHGPGRAGVRAYAAFTALFCVAGGGFSSRHLWLQSLPKDQAPACGPSIDYIIDAFPPGEALEILLRGNGNCAEVDWAFLGISIPGWTLLAFIGIAAIAVFSCSRPARAS